MIDPNQHVAALEARDAEISRLRIEIAQCALELEEAAKLLPLANLKSVATIYKAAAERARSAIA